MTKNTNRRNTPISGDPRRAWPLSESSTELSFVHSDDKPENSRYCNDFTCSFCDGYSSENGPRHN